MSKEIHVVFRVLNFLHSDESKDYQLTSAEERVLITLASHQGQKGIYPSVPTLSRELNKSERTVYRLIDSLENKNLITVDSSMGKSNHYYLPFLSTTPDTHDRGQLSTTPDIDVTPPLTSMTQTPDTGVTQSTKNNKRNNRESAKKRALPLTVSFLPNEEHERFAIERGFTNDQAKNIFKRFREYHFDRDTKSKDWDAKFMDWLKMERQPKNEEEGLRRVNNWYNPAHATTTEHSSKKEYHELMQTAARKASGN